MIVKLNILFCYSSLNLGPSTNLKIILFNKTYIQPLKKNTYIQI